MGLFYPMAKVIDQRRQEIDRTEQIGGGVMRVCGFVTITDPGEVIVPVNFPVTFTEKPSFSYGAEIAPNSPLEIGKYPTISVVVRSWRFELQPDNGARRYVGASLLSVSTGVAGQGMIVHYQMEGKAILGPNG